MHLKKLFAVALTLFATIALMAGTAKAQVSRAVIQQSTPEGLPGFITSDVLIDFTGLYTGSQMIIELTSGEIYQNANNPLPGPPLDALIPADPTVVWDTFIANGGPAFGDTIGNFGPGSAAINVDREKGDGPQRDGVFSDMEIDQAWNPAGGNDGPEMQDQEGFMTARVTLSDDANGTFRYFASANNIFGPQELVTGTGLVIGGGGDNGISVPIINGVIGIPEPSTFVLLGISLVGLVALKRRNG